MKKLLLSMLVCVFSMGLMTGAYALQENSVSSKFTILAAKKGKKAGVKREKVMNRKQKRNAIKKFKKMKSKLNSLKRKLNNLSVEVGEASSKMIDANIATFDSILRQIRCEDPQKIRCMDKLHDARSNIKTARSRVKMWNYTYLCVKNSKADKTTTVLSDCIRKGNSKFFPSPRAG